MSWIAAGIAGGSALIKLGSGIAQDISANKAENAMQRPVEGVQPEYTQNVNTAQQQAQQGIAAPAYNNQLNSINRNQATALNTLSKSANPGANLAAIVRQGDEATNQLNAQDSIERNRNLLGLLNARLQLAQQKDKAWDWNYQQRYLQNLAKANQLRGAANSNISGAFSDATGSAVKLSQLGAFNGSGGGSQYGSPDGSSISATSNTGSGGFGGNPYGGDSDLQTTLPGM